MVTRFSHSPDPVKAHGIFENMVRRPPVVTPREVDKPLVLYGAGSLGRMAKNYCDRLSIPIQYVLDANPQAANDDTFWEHTDIRHPDEAPTSDRQNALIAICIVNHPYHEIAGSLKDRGWDDMVMFYDITEAYRDQHPLSNGWFAGELDSQDKKHISELMEAWDDNLSRAHYLQFLAWRYLREDWVFGDAPIEPDTRFFIPPVRQSLPQNAGFADVGAHHGEISLQFIERAPEPIRHVWAIEPDRENYRTMLDEFSSLGEEIREKITPIRSVISDDPGKRHFASELNYASQIHHNGSEILGCTTIDALDIAPSFIKLHIEGHELQALQGAAQTLQRHRPIIASTIYHNREGLWKTPLWCVQHLPNYRFLFRLHNWCGTGAVLYAIPGENGN